MKPEVYIPGSFIIFVAGLSSCRSQSPLAVSFQSLKIKAIVHPQGYESSHAMNMARDASSVLYHDLSVALIHTLSISYFSLLAANFLCGFLSLPLHQARSVLPDDLVVLFFLVTVATFSFFCLRSRITQKTPDLEQASVIVFIALSTVSFVYFQFYHDTWSRGFYMVMFSLCGLRSISQFWESKTSFREVCLGYGMLCLIPAIHASIWPSACRQPMTLHFIAFSSFNAIGGLNYVLRVPERLGGIGSRPISCFLMHISTVVAAIFLSEKLFAAKASDTTFFADECRGLTWWCQLHFINCGCMLGKPPFYLELEITSKL